MREVSYEIVICHTLRENAGQVASGDNIRHNAHHSGKLFKQFGHDPGTRAEQWAEYWYPGLWLVSSSEYRPLIGWHGHKTHGEASGSVSRLGITQCEMPDGWVADMTDQGRQGGSCECLVSVKLNVSLYVHTPLGSGHWNTERELWCHSLK